MEVAAACTGSFDARCLVAEAGSGLSCRIAGAEAAAVVGRSEEAGKSCHGYINGLALVLCRKDYMQ